MVEVGSHSIRMLWQRGQTVYITGDIYYHTAQDMLSDGLLALDPGHYIEVLFVEKIAELLNQWKEEKAGQSILYLVKHRPILSTISS